MRKPHINEDLNRFDQEGVANKVLQTVVKVPILAVISRQKIKINKLRLIYLVIVLIGVFTNCPAQQAIPAENKTYYDTISLLVPKLSKEDIATPADYKHCLDLTHNDYVVILSGIKYTLEERNLAQFVKSNKKEINKRKISIIASSETSYDKIINAIDIMESEKVRNYKLVWVDGKFPEPAPIIVQSNKPFKKDIDLSDSTVLVISYFQDSSKVSLLNKTIAFSQITELDTFIITNKSNINPDKIFVRAPANSKYHEIIPILDILAKYNYNNYHLKAID